MGQQFFQAGVCRRRDLPEQGQAQAQVVQAPCARYRCGLLLLGEFLADGVGQNRDVGIPGLRQPEGALQGQLPQRRLQQVRAAHHLGDALGGVVDHHGELVGPQAVSPADHEGAFLVTGIAAHLALDAVDEGLHAGVHVEPPGHRDTAGRRRGGAAGMATAAGVQLRARQRTGKGTAFLHQLRQGLRIVAVAPALPDNLAVPGEAVVFEAVQDGIGRTGLFARWIEVLDAHQPAATGGPRVQPAGQRAGE
jgi:hypothetical protein